jgi:hypothetical protein
MPIEKAAKSLSGPTTGVGKALAKVGSLAGPMAERVGRAGLAMQKGVRTVKHAVRRKLRR